MNKSYPIPSRGIYSEALKLQVVRQYEGGHFTKDDLMKKYKLGGHSLVLQWCRKYGKLYYSKSIRPGRPMKDPQKRKIKELEQALKEAREKIMVYEKLIEVAKRESGIEIIKNTDTKLSENWQSRQKG